MNANACPDAATIRTEIFDAPRTHAGRLVAVVFACRDHAGDVAREHVRDRYGYPTTDTGSGQRCGHVDHAEPGVPASREPVTAPTPRVADDGNAVRGVDTPSTVGCRQAATVRLECSHPDGRPVYVLHTCYRCSDRVARTYAPHLRVDWTRPAAARRCGDVTTYAAGT